MRARTIALAILSGVAALLVVGVLVTELAAPRIEFSLFVGIPAGVVAGIAAATFVLARIEDLAPARRRPALALAGFGAAFVVTLVVAVALGLRNAVAFPVAAVVGGLSAGAAYLRSGR